MLWEGESMSETAARLEELGVGVVVFHPCFNVPYSGDYLSALQSNVGNLQSAFGT